MIEFAAALKHLGKPTDADCLRVLSYARLRPDGSLWATDRYTLIRVNSTRIDTGGIDSDILIPHHVVSELARDKTRQASLAVDGSVVTISTATQAFTFDQDQDRPRDAYPPVERLLVRPGKDHEPIPFAGAVKLSNLNRLNVPGIGKSTPVRLIGGESPRKPVFFEYVFGPAAQEYLMSGCFLLAYGASI